MGQWLKWKFSTTSAAKVLKWVPPPLPNYSLGLPSAWLAATINGHTSITTRILTKQSRLDIHIQAQQLITATIIACSFKFSGHCDVFFKTIYIGVSLFWLYNDINSPGSISFGDSCSIVSTLSSWGAWITSTVEPIIDKMQPIFPCKFCFSFKKYEARIALEWKNKARGYIVVIVNKLNWFTNHMPSSRVQNCDKYSHKCKTNIVVLTCN